MKIKPEELAENGYSLLTKLDHKELVPFVRYYLNKGTGFTFFYYAANFFIFASLVGAILFYRKEFGLAERFSYFSIGLAAAFLLLPLHEYIHVWAYRFVGAKQTSFAANFKKFYFMALAHHFVAGKKEFRLIALAPFSTISIVLFFLLIFSSPLWTIALLSVLLAHTAMCSGDFGLLSFFSFQGDKEIVTYDDVENKISYFYAKQ